VACSEMLWHLCHLGTFVTLGMVWCETPAWDRARVAGCQKWRSQKGNRQIKIPLKDGEQHRVTTRGRAPMPGRFLARGTVTAQSTSL